MTNKLREAIRTQIHIQGCQSYDHGWNDHVDGKDHSMEWIEQYEEGIIDELLSTVIEALVNNVEINSNEDYCAAVIDMKHLLEEAKKQ